MEDRSALFNQLKNFSQRKLKKVETKVVTASGEQLVEKRGAKGLQVLSGVGSDSKQDQNAEPPRKLDLQVGLILPGFLLGSQDVAHDKSSLDSYGITHILNLDSQVENKFEDDYNYKNINIHDRPDFDLNNIFDDCFDFIDDGRHYGNVLIHCSGTIGLSRSTTICIAYLMSKEKQKFDEAFNNVKEARSFVKPNEGFIKQLKEYEIKLRGAQQVKESGIDDPFALRKKQEIEQEKAMVAGAASVKNRMKMFGATLDTNNSSSSPRSKSVSPMPTKQQQQQPQSPSVSKWSTQSSNKTTDKTTMQSKSMTPEPRKTWQQTSSSSSSTATATTAPPPPPPPMPTINFLDDKSKNKSIKSSYQAPPPPPPPLPASLDLRSSASPSKNKVSKSITTSDNNESHNLNQDRRDSDDNKRMVFGRVPPPTMKIKGGLSIERHDPTSDKNMGLNNCYGLESNDQVNLRLRCSSPLVLMNNVQPQLLDQNNQQRNTTSQQNTPSINSDDFDRQIHANTFRALQQQFQQQSQQAINESARQQLPPKRTVSLGPRRKLEALTQPPKQISNHTLRRTPFIQESISNQSTSNSSSLNKNNRFDLIANELQSSLTELNNLIDSTPPVTPKITTKPIKPPRFDTSYLIDKPPPSNQSPPKPSFGRKFSSSTTDLNQENYYYQINKDNNDDKAPPVKQIQTWNVEEDLMDWKSRGSMNDLRSLFEKQSQVHNNKNSSSTLSVNTLSNTQRPPRSASQNILINSPWQNKHQQSLQPPPLPTTATTTTNYGREVFVNNSNSNAGDYTIRRTISTSSSRLSNVRNPYRGHY